MILRSQLRMNKNIVFPFISCIMLMFTLLVLLHKATDELNAVRKELSRCKEQHESTFTQLQNAIDMKLRLEKSLENEKSEGKQKLDKIQALLDLEKEDRLKEKNEASMKYDSLNEKLDSLQTANADFKDQIEKLNKRILESEKEIHDANSKLEDVHDENERKNQMIHKLEMQLKTEGNTSISLKKQTPSDDTGLVANESLKVAPVQSLIKDSPTPPINPAAVKQDEELSKQMPPPDREPENSLQKEKADVINDGIPQQIRPPQENVGKAPLVRIDSDNKEVVPIQNNAEDLPPNGDKERGMFIPRPPNFNQPNKPASSASNNAAENPGVFVPYPKLVEKKGNVAVPKSKDYLGAEYDNNIPEDEGEDGYVDNRNKEMN